MASSGGRFLANSADPTPLEGGWVPPNLSVVEFPSYEAAYSFYHSDEYQEVLQIGLQSANRTLFILEGL